MTAPAEIDVAAGLTSFGVDFSGVAFPAPLFRGATLHAETEEIDRRESDSGRARGGCGIVTFAHVGRDDQHGDVVATASRKTLVPNRS